MSERRERGLDTNVLVRYLVGDDAEQYEQARALVEDELTPDDPGLVLFQGEVRAVEV